MRLNYALSVILEIHGEHDYAHDYGTCGLMWDWLHEHNDPFYIQRDKELWIMHIMGIKKTITIHHIGYDDNVTTLSNYMTGHSLNEVLIKAVIQCSKNLAPELLDYSDIDLSAFEGRV